MPAQNLLPPLGPRLLGRDTEATLQHWQLIKNTMPIAPLLMLGETPRKSPPIWRFINPRKHHQTIGMCVGRSACRMKELLLRVPPNATASSDPLPAVNLSSLWEYYIARKYSFDHGVNLGPEPPGGAIVSHSVQASAQSGAITLDMWPDNESDEQQFSRQDRRPVPAADTEFGKKHLVTQYAILDTLDKQFQYMSQGFAIQTGMAVTEGWLQTDGKGVFGNRGKVIGGHATCTIGYDLDAGWVAILNSWPQWGKRSTDPMFASTDGYTNIGYMAIEDYRRQFSDQKIQIGESEAVVVNTVGGFTQPLIRFDWRNLYGSSQDQPA
jgi:hypothetical protein